MKENDWAVVGRALEDRYRQEREETSWITGWARARAKAGSGHWGGCVRPRALASK